MKTRHAPGPWRIEEGEGMSLFDVLCRKRRVITQLRKAFPGAWSYDPLSRQWEHESGWYVYAVACLSPQWDGDDESYVVQYRRSDNGSVVLSSGRKRGA